MKKHLNIKCVISDKKNKYTNLHLVRNIYVAAKSNYIVLKYTNLQCMTNVLFAIQ